MGEGVLVAAFAFGCCVNMCPAGGGGWCVYVSMWRACRECISFWEG